MIEGVYMHIGSMERMKWFVQTYLSSRASPVSVLDVGSYGVNGTYRELFAGENFKYTGLDVAAGPNVDIVADKPYDWYMIPDGAFDAVISGQAFEHIEFFWLTMSEIARVLRPGGLACIIAPRGFDRHRYPIDAFRFDADGMIALARYTSLKPLHASCNLAPPGAPAAWYSCVIGDSMLVAEKPQDWPGVINPKTYQYTAADLEKLATGFITYVQAIAAAEVKQES